MGRETPARLLGGRHRQLQCGDNALANVPFYPVKKLMFGPEIHWARRESFRDGFTSDDLPIQFPVKHNFSHTFGGN